jgi:diadenosine tetraphosphatase ApaH/serine/threonine PP2A family protein phosphatase
LTALEAVLADIEKQGGTDEIWCLGDIVGYGPDPHECLEIVRTRCSLCVAGNHDLASIGKLDTSTFNEDAAGAADWSSRQLNAEDVSYLAGLPLRVEKDNFTLVHGSPREPVWEYILSVQEAEENLGHFKTRFCLIGHSHIAMYFKCGNFYSAGRPNNGAVLQLSDQRYIINPGGVGQPRDSDPRAAYAVYDSDTNAMVFHRVSYDIPAVQSKMQKAGLPFWLSERLAYGR